MLRHPSVAQTIASTAVLGPATFSSFNSLFGVLADAGLDEQEIATATTALMSYTLGFTLFSIARARADADTTEWRRAGLQGVDPTEYPALYHLRDHLLANTYDVQFTDGVTRLVHAYLPTTRK
jgi:Tetracyclin repressor-like, C-terminal domain